MASGLLPGHPLPWFVTSSHGEGGGPVVCDLFSVDGLYDYDGILVDIINAIWLIKLGGMIIVEDTSDRLTLIDILGKTSLKVSSDDH